MSIFNKAKILVIGDAMLDKYSFGNTNRISPEAPVPVLKIEKEGEIIHPNKKISLIYCELFRV